MKHQLPLLTALCCIPLLAGPPLICHPIDIGHAQSLPWRANAQGWDGGDPGYDTRKIVPDTLVLLAPSTPIPVRMETLRRAAIYSARSEASAYELSGRLMARALDGEASGKADWLAWFDAGYYAETLRQVTFIYRYDMLTPAERTAWKVRGDRSSVDGYEWVRRAQRLAGNSAAGRAMDAALVKMEEYRKADRTATAAATAAR